MAKAPRKPADAAAPPAAVTVPTLPVAPPGPPPENWTMQALNQLTMSVGRMEAAVSGLSQKVDEVKADQASLAGRIDTLERKLLVAGAIVTVVMVLGSAIVGVGAYVADKAIDFGLDMAKDKLSEPDSQVAPPTLPPASPPKQ